MAFGLVLLIGLIVGFLLLYAPDVKPIGFSENKNLTANEIQKVINITLADTNVKNEISSIGGTYTIGDVYTSTLEGNVPEKYPGYFPVVPIIIGKEDPGLTMYVYVDIQNEKVISINRQYRKPSPPP